MRYHVIYRTPDDDVYGERELHLDGHEGYDDGVEHVHVFTDDELGRDGHNHIPWPNMGNKHEVTHVAIPVEQYVRIFGEL